VLSSAQKPAAHGGLMARAAAISSPSHPSSSGNGAWLKEMTENPGYHPIMKSPLQDARAEMVRELRRKISKERSRSDLPDGSEATRIQIEGDESASPFSLSHHEKKGNPSWSFMTPERDKAFRSFSSILLGVKESRKWIDGTPPVGHYRPKYDIIEPNILSPDIRLHPKHVGRKATPVSKKSHHLVPKSEEEKVVSSRDVQLERRDITRRLFGETPESKKGETTGPRESRPFSRTGSYDITGDHVSSKESLSVHLAPPQGRHRRSRSVLGIGPSEMENLRAIVDKNGLSKHLVSGRRQSRGIISMDGGDDDRMIEEMTGEGEDGKEDGKEEEEKKKKKKMEEQKKKMSAFLSANAKEKREKRPEGGWAFRSTTLTASQMEIHLGTPDKFYDVEEGLRVIESRPDVVTSLPWEKMSEVSRNAGGNAVMYGGIADPVDKPRPRSHSGIFFGKQTTREVASTLVATQMSRKELMATSTSRQVEEQEYPAKGYYRDISWDSLERTSRHLRTPSPVNMRRMRSRVLHVEPEDVTTFKKDDHHTSHRTPSRSVDPVVHEVREAIIDASVPSVYQVERGERILSTRKRMPVLVDMKKQTTRPSPILTHVNTHLDYGDAKSPAMISSSHKGIAFDRMGGREYDPLVVPNGPATDFYDGRRDFVEPRSPSMVMKSATKKKLPMQAREQMKREEREEREQAREKEKTLRREREKREERRKR
jgi:hypothetical protein